MVTKGTRALALTILQAIKETDPRGCVVQTGGYDESDPADYIAAIIDGEFNMEVLAEKMAEIFRT